LHVLLLVVAHFILENPIEGNHRESAKTGGKKALTGYFMVTWPAMGPLGLETDSSGSLEQFSDENVFFEFFEFSEFSNRHRHVRQEFPKGL
jgi:hypothetical protein